MSEYVLRNAAREAERVDQMVIGLDRVRQVLRGIQRLAVQRESHGDAEALDMIEAMADVASERLSAIIDEMHQVAEDYVRGKSEICVLPSPRKNPCH